MFEEPFLCSLEKVEEKISEGYKRVDFMLEGQREVEDFFWGGGISGWRV